MLRHLVDDLSIEPQPDAQIPWLKRSIQDLAKGAPCKSESDTN